MALNPKSYGSVAGVAGLVPRFTVNGTFDDTTRPPLEILEYWINQASAMLNVCLSEQGFLIPVTQADAKLMLDAWVEAQCARMVERLNPGTRFGPNSPDRGTASASAAEWMALLRDAACAFVHTNASGLEALGAGRTAESTAGMTFYVDVGGDNQPFFTKHMHNWPGKP